MTGHLVPPTDAVAALRERVGKKWAEAICAEHGVTDAVTFSVPLRPGVTTTAAVERLGYDVWAAWTAAWRTFATHLPDGVRVADRQLSVQRVRSQFPAALVADDLDAALQIVGDEVVDVGRARDLARSLVAAGADLSPALLRKTYGLVPADATMLVAAVTWLSGNPDAGGLTARQLRVPGLHTKWLERNGPLLRQATGRDVLSEVRTRPAVVHLTYVDPGYLAGGRRRHDAWTTGDVHDLAYRPRTVLVVENRDSRLWFPDAPDTIVVEGGGKAAASLLSDIPWIRTAEHVVYWGDMDTDGYSILDRFRDTMAAPSAGLPARPVHSILMDGTDLNRYAAFGISTDKNGVALRPSSVRLDHLTSGESAAYDAVATGGEAPFRRIEQELIPLTDAAERLHEVIAASRRHPRPSNAP